MGWIQNIFNSNEAQLRSLRRIADRIEALNSQYSAMTDEELQAQTAVLRLSWHYIGSPGPRCGRRCDAKIAAGLRCC